MVETYLCFFLQILVRHVTTTESVEFEAGFEAGFTLIHGGQPMDLCQVPNRKKDIIEFKTVPNTKCAL